MPLAGWRPCWRRRRDAERQQVKLRSRAESQGAGSSGRLCHPKGSSRKARLTRTGLRCEWTLPQRRLAMASRGESGKPTRHCRLRLALLSVLSPPRTEAGASSPAREAHGHQPNSRHVPSRKSAPESRKTRSDKVFRWALSDGIPYAKKG